MEQNLKFLEANKYLIRFYYVYQFKNFNKAAENFYITVTDRNMKYAVTQLEMIYDVQLIKVIGNKLEFTDFGHLLGEQSALVYEQNIKINSILNSINLKEVKFATTFDFYQYFVKPIFLVFQKKYPASKVIFLKTNQYDATERLLKREINFAVGTLPMKPHPDLVYQKIAAARIFLAVLKENEEKFKNMTSLNDLTGFNGAMNDFTDPFYYNFKAMEAEQNLNLNMAYLTTDFDSLIELVENKFVDYSLVGNYTVVPGLALIDISHLFKPVEICFIYRRKESFTRTIEILINISKQLNIIPEN